MKAVVLMLLTVAACVSPAATENVEQDVSNPEAECVSRTVACRPGGAGDVSCHTACGTFLASCSPISQAEIAYCMSTLNPPDWCFTGGVCIKGAAQ